MELGMKNILALVCGAVFAGAGLGQTTKVAGEAEPVVPAGVEVLRDLEYVPQGQERNRLDLYLPEKGEGRLPVIVWIHGGGWEAGDKRSGPAIAFSGKGYAVAAINHRLSQHAIFPAQIQDCKAAIRWLRANAGKYRLDADHIGVWGASSGGHLAALMGTTADVKEFEGDGGNPEQSSRVQAVVDWFGPTNFLTAGIKDTRTNLLGADPRKDPERATKASPAAYVSKDSSPFLIMHGDADATVPYEQSVTFAEALKKAGAEVTMVTIKGGGHGGAGFETMETMKQIEDFLDKYLKGGRVGEK
jgi:acetyl esterase/lipase